MNHEHRATYTAFDRIVEGPVGLALAGADGVDESPAVRLERDPGLVDEVDVDAEPVHEIADFPGGPTLRIGRRDGDLVIDYDGRVYALEPDAGLIRYASKGAEEPHFAFAMTVERVLLPLLVLFSDPSTLALHGSAIAVDGRAFVFIGPSGVGKSTSAYEAMRRGARLLADDMTLIDVEREVALGAGPTVRLIEEAGALPEALDERGLWHRNDKRWFRLPDESAAAGAVPLGAVVLLEPTSREEVSERRLEPIRGRAGLVHLLEQTFDFSRPWPSWQRRRFRLAARLVKARPVLRFRYVRSESGEPAHVGPLFEALTRLETARQSS
ncbi:MAG: HPr kinase/phosphorylase [Persicimonas sp.]